MTTAAALSAASPPRALLLEGVDPSAHAALAAAGVHVRAEAGALSGAQLAARLGEVELLGIRSKSQLTAAALAAAPGLWAVGCFCIGVNQVDLDAATHAGVPVFNAPFSNTRSVAELVICEVVALARQLGDRSREMHGGRWRKGSAACIEVRGKTLGIVGYGHIGSQVGVLAEGLGMRVVAHDVVPKLPLGNVRLLATLGELLGASDFVSLHVPATTATANLLDAAALRQMRQGSYLINLSRGSVVELDALARALATGHLRGAALDVFPEEPDGVTDAFVTPLSGRPNVLLTPHVGGSTEEAQAAIGREVGSALARFVTGGSTLGAVNFPQVDLVRRGQSHRIMHVHRNVPGVLGEVGAIVARLQANIQAQTLATAAATGYLIMDLDRDVAGSIGPELAALPTTVRTRTA